jgi:hypothetical protein
MPGDSGGPRGDYARVVLLFPTRGCGCNGHPAFPTPSFSSGETIMHRSGEIAPRDRGGVGGIRCSHPSRRGENAAPQDEVRSWDVARPHGEERGNVARLEPCARLRKCRCKLCGCLKFEIESGGSFLSLPHLRGRDERSSLLGWLEAPRGGSSRIDPPPPTRHIVRSAHDVPALPTSGRDKKERASLALATKCKLLIRSALFEI